MSIAVQTFAFVEIARAHSSRSHFEIMIVDFDEL